MGVLSWDERGQLSEVKAGELSTLLTHNDYRMDGLRAVKQPGSGARTPYLYDGLAPVAESEPIAEMPHTVNTFGLLGLVSRTTYTPYNVGGNGGTRYTKSTVYYVQNERHVWMRMGTSFLRRCGARTGNWRQAMRAATRLATGAAMAASPTKRRAWCRWAFGSTTRGKGGS